MSAWKLRLAVWLPSKTQEKNRCFGSDFFLLVSKGDAVPPGYVSGSEETGNDTPLSSAQRTRPRRRKVNCPEGAREGALGYGAGRGKKVRYTPRLSWGILRGALRCACPSSLPAARLDGNSARSAQKSTPLACFSFSCRIPTKSGQAGQACRSRPRKIPYKSQGVYLTFIPLPRDTYPRAPSLAPSGQFTLCPEPPLPCRGEGGIPFGFAGTEGVSRGGQSPPWKSVSGQSPVSPSYPLRRGCSGSA